jgi:hypothetical protein
MGVISSLIRKNLFLTCSIRKRGEWIWEEVVPSASESFDAGVLSVAIIDVRFSQHSGASFRTQEQQGELGFTCAAHCPSERDSMLLQVIGGYSTLSWSPMCIAVQNT